MNRAADQFPGRFVPVCLGGVRAFVSALETRYARCLNPWSQMRTLTLVRQALIHKYYFRSNHFVALHRIMPIGREMVRAVRDLRSINPGSIPASRWSARPWKT